MTSAVFSAEEETPLRGARALMLRKRIHRVMITRDGKLPGIVTSIDMLRLVAGPLRCRSARPSKSRYSRPPWPHRCPVEDHEGQGPHEPRRHREPLDGSDSRGAPARRAAHHRRAGRRRPGRVLGVVSQTDLLTRLQTLEEPPGWAEGVCGKPARRRARLLRWR